MTAKAKFVMKTTQISIRAPLVTHQDPQSELIKRCYFADARFRATSPELKRLRSLRENVNLETPGAHLAAALNYYWLEAYSNPSDRNAACHLAGVSRRQIRSHRVRRDLEFRLESYLLWLRHRSSSFRRCLRANVGPRSAMHDDHRRVHKGQEDGAFDCPSSLRHEGYPDRRWPGPVPD